MPANKRKSHHEERPGCGLGDGWWGIAEELGLSNSNAEWVRTGCLEQYSSGRERSQQRVGEADRIMRVVKTKRQGVAIDGERIAGRADIQRKRLARKVAKDRTKQTQVVGGVIARSPPETCVVADCAG